VDIKQAYKHKKLLFVNLKTSSVSIVKSAKFYKKNKKKIKSGNNIIGNECFIFRVRMMVNGLKVVNNRQYLP
jgi:hypothetical protein